MSVFHAHEYVLCTVPQPKQVHSVWENTRHESFVSVVSRAFPMQYECLLCNVTLEEPHFNRHCQEQTHIQRMEEIRRMQGNPITVRSAVLQLRIDQLGLKAWQSEVHDHLYWCLLYQFTNVTTANDRMTEAETLLGKFEHLERVSLLELAAWKAVCIATKDNGCHHSWQEWYDTGWKAAKPETRTAREIGIVRGENPQAATSSNNGAAAMPRNVKRLLRIVVTRKQDAQTVGFDVSRTVGFAVEVDE
jgi:hypothetical protein